MMLMSPVALNIFSSVLTEDLFFFCCYLLNSLSQLFSSYRHHKYIGKVKHAVFHTQKTGRKRVVVSTEENVVASLDLRTGFICEFDFYML